MQLLEINPIFLILYIPVLLAFYALISRYKQIPSAGICLLILSASILTGMGPVIALCILFVIRGHLNERAQPPVSSGATRPPLGQEGFYSDEDNGSTLPASNASPNMAKTTGTVLGGVVGAVLWISGLIVVGFFVIVTVMVIQCANDPKCM